MKLGLRRFLQKSTFRNVFATRSQIQVYRVTPHITSRQESRGSVRHFASTASKRAETLLQPETEMGSASVSRTTRDSMTDTLFSVLPLSNLTQRALVDMQIHTCTQVQAASLPVCLSGMDVICKAKTGTGKTLAFLIPALERMQQAGIHANLVSILVLSPTRELASQIAHEAGKLVKYHKLTVQSLVGGTNMNTDLRKVERATPDVVIATPGRLLDLLGNQSVQQKFSRLQTLVFDEADRLLDMGFKPTIDSILAKLPPKSVRQTTLFSATYPQDIQQLCRTALRPGYQIVDTVGESEVQTAEKIQQSAIVTSLEDHVATLVHIVTNHQRERDDHKVMIFCTTAKLTAMYAEVFRRMGIDVLEIHSRKSQAQRTKVAQAFRKDKRGILFTSDVSARGVDYPDVTLIAQLGLPAERDQYIHRVGRTARAGKQGQAILILQDFEKAFLNSIRDLPVNVLPSLPAEKLGAHHEAVRHAMVGMDWTIKAQAYQTWLGYYKGSLKLLKMSAQQLVGTANEFAKEAMYCSKPPGIPRKTLGKMGLKGVPGITSVANLGDDAPSGRGEVPTQTEVPHRERQGPETKGQQRKRPNLQSVAPRNARPRPISDDLDW